jgi:hypothetical protein
VSISPVEAAAGVDFDTPFIWDAPANTVSWLYLGMERWTIVVVTTESSTTIPDLTELGVVPEPGGATLWWVQSDFGSTTVDEWVRIGTPGATAAPQHGVGAVSAAREFTFAN